MNPLTIGLQVAGLGMQAFGAFGAANSAREAAGINIGIAGDEQKINNQKRLQMEMSARRQQLEVMRNAQRARAQGEAAAVNQGANKGSGLAGGLAQISSQEGFNLQGITGNLEIGRTIFDLNNDISQKKIQLADAQSNQAADTALMSLGGSLVNNAGTIGNIGQYASGSLTSMRLPTGFGGPYV